MRRAVLDRSTAVDLVLLPTLAFFSAQGAMVIVAWLCALTLCALCAYSQSPCFSGWARVRTVIGRRLCPVALFLPLLAYQIMDSGHGGCSLHMRRCCSCRFAPPIAVGAAVYCAVLRFGVPAQAAQR